MMTHYNYIPG